MLDKRRNLSLSRRAGPAATLDRVFERRSKTERGHEKGGFNYGWHE